MTISEPLVSLIMPTYNGEDFITKCLDSLLAQSMHDYELIIVDDGSSDRTPQIIDSYAKQDKRIRIVSQENSGVSSARNHGLDLAKGKYIFFVDDDDWFDKRALEKMSNQMEKDCADICVCDGYRYDMAVDEFIESRFYLVKEYLPEKTPFSPEQIASHIFNFTSMHIYKMYRRGFLESNGLRFGCRKRSEDALFLMIALVSAEAITVVPDRLFYYRVHSGTSVSDQTGQDILAGYDSLCEAKKTLSEMGKFSPAVEQSFANKALGTMLHYEKSARSFEELSVWYTKLALDGGFEDLGIAGHDGSYYYRKAQYEKLTKALNAVSAEDFVFALYLDLKASNEMAQSRIRSLKKKNADIEKKYKSIKSSKAFKIGTTLSYLPRKIRALTQAKKRQISIPAIEEKEENRNEPRQ